MNKVKALSRSYAQTIAGIVQYSIRFLLDCIDFVSTRSANNYVI